MIAPSDVAGSTALHRLEFLFCDLCVWVPNAGGILEGWPDYGLVCTGPQEGVCNWCGQFGGRGVQKLS